MQRQSSQRVTLTPELLQQIQETSNLLASQTLLPTSINLIDLVEIWHPNISHWRDQSLSWQEIHTLLGEHLAHFGFTEVLLKSLQNAYYQASRRINPQPRKSTRKITTRLATLSQHPPKLRTASPVKPSASTGSIDQMVPECRNPEVAAIPDLPHSFPAPAPPLPEVVAIAVPNFSSSVESTALPPDPPSAPIENQSNQSNQSQSDANQSSTLSPAELELALVIPDRYDKAAIARFQLALNQLRSIDSNRWRLLTSAAMESGVNLLGIIAPSVERMNAMYNKY
jgi:hypothetical protein